MVDAESQVSIGPKKNDYQAEMRTWYTHAGAHIAGCETERKLLPKVEERVLITQLATCDLKVRAGVEMKFWVEQVNSFADARGIIVKGWGYADETSRIHDLKETLPFKFP
jgi:hypothetical protein